MSSSDDEPVRLRLRDNLIPLRPSLSGMQLAGWRPGPAAMRGRGCCLLADQRIPVAAAVSLSADVYLPRSPGRYPAVLAFAAYSKELHTAGVPTGTNEIGSPPVFTDRGYAHIVVTRRGMGRSEGEGGVFFGDQDVDDMEKVIAWAAEQQWCNGDVVMFGTSYYGVVQPQVAVRQPPALKAFFCNEMGTDYFRHIVAFGGVPALYFADTWMGANFTEKQYDLRVPPFARALASQVLNSRLKPAWERQVRKRMAGIMAGFTKNTPIRDVREWYANWLFDGKTRELNCIPAGPYHELGKITIPFVVVQNPGYFNLHQFGSYDLFENASTPADRRWMILGQAEYELPAYAWQLEALAFFDHIVHGTANSYADQPAVRYWPEGADTFAGAESFPVPGSQPVRFYLSSGGDDSATHRLSPGDAQRGGSNSWVAVPLGAPVLGGLDEVANQILTHPAVISQDTELSGPVSARLQFSSWSSVVGPGSRNGADCS
jgi:putative CocE/NonD family hydrolase